MASSRMPLVLRAAVASVALLAIFASAATLFPVTGRAAAQETVRLASGTTVGLEPGTTVALATPAFLTAGKRYAFTWAGGGPPQTHTLKRVRSDGWVEVEVAEENVDPSLLIPGQLPTRWLNAALALSIQEMRPLP
jgi:hypothetical protein